MVNQRFIGLSTLIKQFVSMDLHENVVLFPILYRNQELKELGELSPHWDNLRKNVLTHCDQMVNMYQDILTELSKETGVRAITLHTQPMLHFMYVM